MQIEKLRKTNLTVRPNSWERTTADAIANTIVVLLAIVAYFIKLVAVMLFRLKRHLYRLSIILLISYSAYTTLHNVAEAPYVDASEFPVVKNAVSEHDQIVNYIHEVFGKNANKAFLVLSCENNALNPNAVNTFGNSPAGSRDIGIFQINEYWQQVQGKYLFNWRVNIEIAHQIFTENGNSFERWTCGRKLGV